MTGVAQKSKRGGRKVILSYHDNYIVPLSKRNRWSKPPEYVKAFSVPYTPGSNYPNQEREELQVSLVVWSDKRGKPGKFIELVVTGSSIKDAAELAGLSWLRVSEQQKEQVRIPQPVSVWTYPPGVTIVACVQGKKHETLQTWIEEAKLGRGAKRVYDALTSARSANRNEATVDEASLLETLGQKGHVHHVHPAEVSYPYAIARKWSRPSRQGHPQAAGLEPDGAGAPIVSRLPFQPLPPGELSVDSLKRHYEYSAGGNPDRRYDPERVAKVLSLGPSVVYVGIEGFAGYMIFTFPYTEAALLECPERGNAVYILNRDWMTLARMSKRELLSERPAEVTKIVHKGDWFQRLKLAIGS